MQGAVLWGAALLLAAARAALAADVTDEEYARFPRLYHLDDYSSCLSQREGLYCLGTLHITPASETDPTYTLIKEYSSDPHNFDRTLLHRGYCVSSRCPSLAERNASLRFERCVAQWARRKQLRVSLTSLGYCRTHAQEYARAHNPEPLDVPHKVFLLVVGLLVLFNVIGTTYDVANGDDTKKNPKLLSWSVRANWRRLTATYEDGDPRLSALTPVQGIRVLLMTLIIATHAGCIHDMLYLYNPRWVEQASRHPLMMLFLNGTTVVQMFVMLSNFLLAYNMLLVSKTHRLSFTMMPYIIIKRIARTFPLHVLMVGYAATWWGRAGSGPMWPLMVGAESEACRRKFWTHALYVNNLVNPDDICLVQTWFIAADIQLYGLAAALSLYLTQARRRRRARALRLLAALVAAASLLTGLLAYAFDWQSIMYFVYPRTLNNMYKGIPSFSWLYLSPWGSLPACLIGLLAGHLHFELQETGLKLTSFRFLKVPYHLAPVMMVAWILAGNWLREFRQPWFVAAYVGLERPLLSLLGALILIGMVNGLEGYLKRLFAWRGWHAMGRMSLAVLMVHWCINMNIAASRPQPLATSTLSVMVDTVATGWLSYVLAIPLTLMVEMPVMKFITSLVY